MRKNRSLSFSLALLAGIILLACDDNPSDQKIKDEAPTAKRKRYESTSGNWSYSRSYEYNQNGLLAKIKWKQSVPGQSEGSETYLYDDNERPIAIRASTGTEKRFTWSGSLIVKSEDYADGILFMQTLYTYDDTGKVKEAAVYTKLPDSEFELSHNYIFSYKPDGNLFRKLSYSYNEETKEYEHNYTETYDHYLTYKNAFPMAELLPTLNLQPTLATYFSIQYEGNPLFEYQLSYEFSSDGKALKRTAVGHGSTEITVYEYY